MVLLPRFLIFQNTEQAVGHKHVCVNRTSKKWTALRGICVNTWIHGNFDSPGFNISVFAETNMSVFFSGDSRPDRSENIRPALMRPHLPIWEEIGCHLWKVLSSLKNAESAPWSEPHLKLGPTIWMHYNNPSISWFQATCMPAGFRLARCSCIFNAVKTPYSTVWIIAQMWHMKLQQTVLVW